MEAVTVGENQNQRWLAWGLLGVLALIWGSSFILIKKGLVVYSAGEVGALRILSAALFLLPISLPKLKSVSRKQAAYLFLSGLMGSLIPAFLFAEAQTQLSSAVTGVLNALTPLFVLIVGVILFSQKINRESTLGLVIGFVGTAILILAGSGGDLGDMNFYALLVVLATFCYGNNLNLVKFYLQDLRPLAITSVSLFFVGIIAGVYLFTSTGFVDKLMHQEGALLATTAIVTLGVVGTAVALILFNNLVKMTNPLFTSSVTYLIPVVAVIWGILDGENLSIGHFLGMATVITGVYLANRKK
jgi:drug/metabolite transporter (DMT)-like permease